jgi:tetratricopeptide (TPR) repeat protein
MRSRIAVLALVLVAALSIYACKSVETTSAMLHNQTGNYEDAIAQAKAGLAKNPNDAEAYFQLGVSYSYTGEMRQAFDNFMKAAELDPKKQSIVEDNIRSNWARHFNSGIAEFQSDNLEGAAKEFSLSTEADPRMIKGWLNLANVYNTLTETDSTYWEQTFAVTDTLMNRVGEEDDDYDKVLALAGQVMIMRGEKDKAYEIFERLMRDDPVNAEVVEDVGNRFLLEEDYTDAARFLEMAVEGRRQTETESFDLYYNLGVCRLNLDEFLLAADAFQSALVIDPDNRAGNYSLLLSYYQGEFWDEAVLQGEKYTEKFPDDPRGWQILSLVFSKKGMKIKAEEAAMKYQELVGG